MKLIITEKPSVARDIASVLKANQKHEGYIEGNGYLITWALGHLIELCQPDEYEDSLKQWNMEALPILPHPFKTKIIERSAQQFAVVKRLCQAETVQEIICATDAGREGELIFRLIYEETGCQAPIKRLWISSQTDQAIKEGFATLKEGDDYATLYDSAKSRSEADWIVGINATRAYSIKFSRGHGVMSVGRVQTPVLKLIVDRYREHTEFEAKPFYEVLVDVVHPNGTFQATYYKDAHSRLSDKTEANSIKTAIEHCDSGHIADLTEKEVREKQPLLYDLTEIQKDANRLYKFSADTTLKLMQSLYEKHKILSYPRTSSRYISSDIAPKCNALLANCADNPAVKDFVKTIEKNKFSIASRMINDKKVTDHHAIIPTDKKPNLSALTQDEHLIYNCVIRRFVAAFYPECEKHHTDITVLFGPHVLKASGTVIKKPGWRAVYIDESPSKKDEGPQLPIVTQDDSVTHKKVTLKTSKTKAPALYTEASILAAMETAGRQIDDEELRQAMKQCGLGTPATRAQIIEKLIGVKYILREKNKLIPTDKGLYIIDCIQDNVLTSAELTGQWEKQLNDMAQGSIKRSDFMNDIQLLTRDIITKVSENTTYAIRSDQTIYGSCPACNTGKVVEMKQSYSCTQWKSAGCKFVIWKTIAHKAITESMVKTLLKKGKTATLKGFKNKAGNAFNAALELSENQVKFVFDQLTFGPCPCCDGKIVDSPKAYSCNKWKETGCKAIIWKVIAKRPITAAEAKILVDKGVLENCEGFVSKAGKPFSATLTFKEGRVEMVFS